MIEWRFGVECSSVRAWSTKYEARPVLLAPGMACIQSTDESAPERENFHDSLVRSIDKYEDGERSAHRLNPVQHGYSLRLRAPAAIIPLGSTDSEGEPVASGVAIISCSSQSCSVRTIRCRGYWLAWSADAKLRTHIQHGRIQSVTSSPAFIN